MEFNFTKSQLETLQKLVEYPDDFKYPLGTIIASDDPDAVKDKGGQWDQIEDRFLLGAGSTFAVNSTGGEINHELLESEMPSHRHSMDYIFTYTSAGSTEWGLKYSATHGDTVTNVLRETLKTGGSQPHNNMPPYMAKYMWIKTKLQSELEGENI